MALKLDERELVIEILSSLKKFFRFKELENILGITIPTLWRYIHGDIKPSIDRSRQMLMRLLNHDMINTIKERVIKMVDDGIVDVYSLAYNIDVLTIASIDAMLWAQNSGYTAIATVETDGIPLATLIAKRLNTKLITIKRKKEIGFERFVETSYVTLSPPEVVTLYIPDGVIDYGEKILVVDDLVRSGRTSSAVFELIRKAGGRATGFYALIGIGSTWRNVLERYVGNNYRVLFQVEEKGKE